MDDIEITGFETLITNDTYAVISSPIKKLDTGKSVSASEIIQIGIIKVPTPNEVFRLIRRKARSILEGDGQGGIGKFLKVNLSTEELEKIVGEEKLMTQELQKSFPYLPHDIGSVYLNILHGVVAHELFEEHNYGDLISPKYSDLICNHGINEWYSSLRLDSGMKFPSESTLDRIFRDRVESSAEFMVDTQDVPRFLEIAKIGKIIYRSITNPQLTLITDESKSFRRSIARETVENYINRRDDSEIDTFLWDSLSPEDAPKKEIHGLGGYDTPFSKN